MLHLEKIEDFWLEQPRMYAISSDGKLVIKNIAQEKLEKYIQLPMLTSDQIESTEERSFCSIEGSKRYLIASAKLLGGYLFDSGY